MTTEERILKLESEIQKLQQKTKEKKKELKKLQDIVEGRKAEETAKRNQEVVNQVERVFGTDAVQDPRRFFESYRPKSTT